MYNDKNTTVKYLDGTLTSQIYYNINSILNKQNIVELSIGNTITQIDEGTFYKCSNLSNVVFPNSISIICERAFQDCSGLRNIIIPPNVKINEYAFNNCKNLENILLEASSDDEWTYDELIGPYCFSNCNKLSNAIIEQHFTYGMGGIGLNAFIDTYPSLS